MRVPPDQELAVKPFLRQLGSDVFDREWRTSTVRLHEDRFSGSPRWTLDRPGLHAGIGNYLRSEILPAAGRSPAWRPVE